jgi:hypothetical protein
LDQEDLVPGHKMAKVPQLAILMNPTMRKKTKYDINAGYHQIIKKHRNLSEDHGTVFYYTKICIMEKRHNMPEIYEYDKGVNPIRMAKPQQHT